jgi:CheY-like chemotaxis protein
LAAIGAWVEAAIICRMDAGKIEILVADDMADMQMLLGRILRELGCRRIAYASNGADAIEQARGHKFHLAFLDINMPRGNGLEVAKALQVKQPRCFCAIVSGESDGDTVRQALAAGARAYVVKPFSAQKIAEVLAKYAASVTTAPGTRST